MVRAHDVRLVKPFDEESGFVIDRQAEWDAHAAQSVRAYKTGGMLKEGGEHVAVIDRVDHAKMSAGIAVFFEMRPVDHRHDPPGRLAIAKSDKRLNFIFKHQGRPLLVEHLERLVVKRLDPARIAGLSAVSCRHKSGDVGRALNLR